VLTSDVNVGENTIVVNKESLEYINPGYYLNLYDGVETIDMGMVISVDTLTNTITMENTSSSFLSASTPTYIRRNIYLMKDVEIGHGWNNVYGEAKILSSYVPANTIIKMIYENKTSQDKRIVMGLEILY
jgi:hypothetical protein